MKTNRNYFFEFIFIFALIFYTIDTTEVWGFRLFLVVAPFTLMYFFSRKISKDFLITGIFLLLFSVTFSLIMYGHGYTGKGLIPVYLLFPFLAFIGGYFISETDKSYRKVYSIVFLFMIATTGFVFLSYLQTISVYGSLENVTNVLGGRLIASFWDVSSPIRATSMAVMLLFGLSLLPTVLVATPKSKWFLGAKILTVVSFITSMIMALQVGSRTSVMVAVISLIAYILFVGKFNLKKIYGILSIALVGGIGRYLFNRDIFNMKTAYEETVIYERFQESGLESARYDAWEQVLTNFFAYPLGRREIDLKLGYAHNLWLDVVYDVGWIAGVLLIVFMVISLIVLFKFMKFNHPLYLKAIMLLTFVGFYIFFMTEPTLSGGQRVYFVLYTFFVGILVGLNKRTILKEKNYLN